MNKLIIAEKPMLARDIARVMCGHEGKMPVRGNGYTVVSCAGHLLELAEPADIKAEWGKWDLSLLPIAPNPWPKKISHGKADLVKIIKEELKKCDSVINAGDPDDEGQLIVDEVLDFLKYRGRVERVYISDSIDKNIKKAFGKLKDNNSCRPVGDGALARQIADYAFGVNESRLAGLRLGEKVSVGRVQTPTLGLVVNRDRAIEAHKVQKFYELICKYKTNGVEVDFNFVPNKKFLEGKDHIYDKKKLSEVIDKLPNDFNLKLSEKEKKENAPLPFNLTKLQGEMSKKYGFSAKKTMQITQSLRDKFKAITYNRTDCQYLSEEHYKEAKDVVNIAIANLGQKDKWKLDFKLKHKAFNDKNVSAHHAIIPQEIKLDINKMSEDELKVYKQICYRYFKLFLPPCIIRQVSGSYEMEEGELKICLTKTIQKGWKSKEELEDDKAWLDSGAYTFNLCGEKIEEKETKPPKRYTEGTLIADMASIAKYCQNEEIKEVLKKKDEDKKGEHGGIGTTATRADIIERLKIRKFIEKKGKQIISTEFGREFYDLIPDDIKVADVTANWWLIQEDIALGKKKVYDLMDDVINKFNEHKNTAYLDKNLSSSKNKTIGVCPVCGEGVVLGDKICQCSSNKSEKRGDKWVEVSGCGFKMFRTVANKKLSETQVKKLLSGSVEVNGLKSKAGKAFNAELKIKNPKGKNGFAEIEFVFKK